MYGHHAPALAMLHSSGGGPGLYVPGDEADNAAASSSSSSSSSNAAASTAEGAMIGNAAQGLGYLCGYVVGQAPNTNTSLRIEYDSPWLGLDGCDSYLCG